MIEIKRNRDRISGTRAKRLLLVEFKEKAFLVAKIPTDDRMEI